MSRYTSAAEELRTNPEQWAAYEASSHCVVLAGPGSGKTKVLTLKLARLLDVDVRAPRGVACVTYNNECVRELQRRLDKLGVEESSRLFVGTLHGFCLRHIVAPYARLAGWALPNPIRVASESERSRILNGVLEKLDIHISDPISVLSNFRKDCIDRTPDQGWTPGDNGLTDICLAYENALSKSGLVDFDGIVRTAVMLVEGHDWLRQCILAKFPVLVVDEYQDLGTALHRLVLSVCFDAGIRLFAVGDPDQSIYGFAGAHPELLNGIASRSDTSMVRLRLNYRSATRIVEASRAALGEDRDYQATKESKGLLKSYRCRNGLDDEVRVLIDNVLPNLSVRKKLGEVVILYSSYFEGDLIEAALKKAAYPYVRTGRNTAYPKTPVTRHIEDMASWCASGWRRNQPRLAGLLERWARMLDFPDPTRYREQRLAIVDFLFKNRESSMPAATWLSAFESVVLNCEDCRLRLKLIGELEAFEAMCKAFLPGMRLSEFTVANLGGQSGSDDHINMLTLHSSKGSEFDAVVIVGADEGRMPSLKALKSKKQLAEAQRLFYVGVSRARDEVHIIYSENVVGDSRQQGPSRFLVEMGRHLKASKVDAR